jgi:hypothetical protein
VTPRPARASRRRRPRAAAVIAACVCALALAACTDQHAVNRVIGALSLRRAPQGPGYLTPGGCRIEAILTGTAMVTLYWNDNKKTFFKTDHRMYGVKAAGLSPRCKRYVKRHLRRLDAPPGQ